LAVASDELPQTGRRGQPNGSQRPGFGLRNRGKPARRQIAGRNDVDRFASLAHRQQSGGGRLDQLIVIERAIGPCEPAKRIVGRAERGGERGQISFFGDGVGANHYAVGPEPDGAGTPFRGGNDMPRQQRTVAIKFRTSARARRR